MKGARKKKCKLVLTRDHTGDVNGGVVEVVSILEPFLNSNPRISQAYITICHPGRKKGLHLHYKKEDRFCVIRGRAEIWLVTCEGYEKIELYGEEPQVVIIPPGVAHGIKCVGNSPCWVLNCPDRPYDKKNPDQDEIEAEW